MDSLLGPTLANAFLCHYENLWLDNCPPEFKPVSYNLNCCLNPKIICYCSLDTRYMNTRHKNLKFTFDFEQNNSLFFRC